MREADVVEGGKPLVREENKNVYFINDLLEDRLAIAL